MKVLAIAVVATCLAGGAFAGACCPSKKKAAPQPVVKKEEAAKSCPKDGESTSTVTAKSEKSAKKS